MFGGTPNTAGKMPALPRSAEACLRRCTGAACRARKKEEASSGAALTGKRPPVPRQQAAAGLWRRRVAALRDLPVIRRCARGAPACLPDRQASCRLFPASRRKVRGAAGEEAVEEECSAGRQTRPARCLPVRQAGLRSARRRTVGARNSFRRECGGQWNASLRDSRTHLAARTRPAAARARQPPWRTKYSGPMPHSRRRLATSWLVPQPVSEQ